MVDQPEFQGFATTRAEALCELLRDGPKTMAELMQFTGWDEQVTRRTLLRLVAAGKVTCVKTGCGVFRVGKKAGSDSDRSSINAYLNKRVGS